MSTSFLLCFSLFCFASVCFALLCFVVVSFIQDWVDASLFFYLLPTAGCPEVGVQVVWRPYDGAERPQQRCHGRFGGTARKQVRTSRMREREREGDNCVSFFKACCVATILCVCVVLACFVSLMLIFPCSGET